LSPRRRHRVATHPAFNGVNRHQRVILPQSNRGTK
jgi:hypothetical protein